MNREAFGSIRELVILTIISEYKEGVTGYQLQETYDFPRGTLVRTLSGFEEDGCLSSSEEIIEGRTNRFYKITNKGKQKLESLKKEWAGQFAMMSEMVPPEKYARTFYKEGMKHFLKDRIEELSSIEDAEDFFKGVRSKIKSMLSRLQLKQKNLNVVKEEVSMIIEKINQMEELDKEELKDLLQLTFKKINHEQVE